MGTSAITILKNRVLDWETKEQKDVTVAKFYRHYDGYLTGHGADIAAAIVNAACTERKKYIRFDGKGVTSLYLIIATGASIFSKSCVS